MKLYIDNSFLNRPFDSQDISINKLEADILFIILEYIKDRAFILVNSFVIKYENSLNPYSERKIFVENILELSKFFQNANAAIQNESQRLNNVLKISAIDALHLASAHFAKVDYFITCDYNLIKRYKGDLKVVALLNFFQEYGNYKNK